VIVGGTVGSNFEPQKDCILECCQHGLLLLLHATSWPEFVLGNNSSYILSS
jgi:hypothetical protein